jgi:hypothetical protein
MNNGDMRFESHRQRRGPPMIKNTPPTLLRVRRILGKERMVTRSTLGLKP